MVVSKADVIKHMLSMPILNGRMGKWILALSEFDLRYKSTKAVKGQVIVDFITQHHKPSIGYVELIPWTLFFDGSSCKQGGGIGIVIVSPRGASFEFAFPIKPVTTNNQAEYEVILKGLQLLHEIKAESIEVFRDSQLVINQLIGLYECKYDILRGYHDECRKLLEGFPLTSLQHIPRAQNQEANWLAQNASGYRVFQEILSSETLANDWRVEIADYLKNPSQKVTPLRISRNTW